jgi:hypothetical protein
LLTHVTAQVFSGSEPSVLIGEKLEDLLTYRQTKRDGSLRGIVEITA